MMLDQLNERKREIKSRLDEIEAAAAARVEGEEGGVPTFTEDEETEYDGLLKESEKIEANIKRIEARTAMIVDEVSARPRDVETGLIVPGDDDSGGPFRSLGEQLAAVVAASEPGATPDDRLFKVVGPTGGSARVGTDGGFLIQPTFSGNLFDAALEQSLLASRADVIPIGPNSDRLSYWYPEKYDRTTGNRWGGVQVFWRAEADTVTATKPKLSEGELKLQELMALSYATDQQLEDVVQYEAILGQAFSEEFALVLDEAVINGTGVGKPTGILQAPSLVSVAKEGSQAADTLLAENFIKMWARLPQRFRANSAWFVNPQSEEQMPLLKLATGSSSGTLVYMPPGGLSGSQFATLFGRPIIPTDLLPKLGDQGDVILADMRQYALIRKGGIKGDTSMHVRFLHGEQTFRWTARINGMPKLKTSITPANANTGFKLSAFITLDAR